MVGLDLLDVDPVLGQRKLLVRGIQISPKVKWWSRNVWAPWLGTKDCLWPLRGPIGRVPLQWLVSLWGIRRRQTGGLWSWILKVPTVPDSWSGIVPILRNVFEFTYVPTNVQAIFAATISSTG